MRLRRLLSIFLCMALCLSMFSTQSYGATMNRSIKVMDSLEKSGDFETGTEEEPETGTEEEPETGTEEEPETGTEEEPETGTEEEPETGTEEEPETGTEEEPETGTEEEPETGTEEEPETGTEEEPETGTEEEPETGTEEEPETGSEEEPETEEEGTEAGTEEGTEASEEKQEPAMMTMEAEVVPLNIIKAEPIHVSQSADSMWIKVIGTGLDGITQDNITMYPITDNSINMVEQVTALSYDVQDEVTGQGQLSGLVHFKEDYDLQAANTYVIDLTSGDQTVTFQVEGSLTTYDIPWKVNKQHYLVPIDFDGDIDTIYQGMEGKEVKFYSDEDRNIELAASGVILHAENGQLLVKVMDPAESMYSGDVYYKIVNDFGLFRRTTNSLSDLDEVVVYEVFKSEFWQSSQDQGDRYIIQMRYETPGQDIEEYLSNLTLEGQGETIELRTGGTAGNGVTFGMMNDDLSSIYVIEIDKSINPLEADSNYTLRINGNQTYELETAPVVSQPILLDFYSPIGVEAGTADFNLRMHGLHINDATLSIYKEGHEDENLISSMENILLTEEDGQQQRKETLTLSESLNPDEDYWIRISNDAHNVSVPLGVGDFTYVLDSKGLVVGDQHFSMGIEITNGSYDPEDFNNKNVYFYTDWACQNPAPASGIIELLNGYIPVVSVTTDDEEDITEDTKWYYKIPDLTVGVKSDNNHLEPFSQYKLISIDHKAFQDSCQSGGEQIFRFYTHGMDISQFSFILANDNDDNDQFTITNDMVSLNTDNTFVDVLTLTIPTDQYECEAGERYRVDFTYNEGGQQYINKVGTFKVPNQEIVVYERDCYALHMGEKEFHINFRGLNLSGNADIQVLKGGINIVEDLDIKPFSQWGDDGYGNRHARVTLKEGAELNNDYQIQFILEEQVLYSVPLQIAAYTYETDYDALVANDSQFYTSLHIGGDLYEDEIYGKTVTFYTDSEMTTLAPMVGEVIEFQGSTCIKVDSQDGQTTLVAPDDRWYYEIEGLTNGLPRTKNKVKPYSHIKVIARDMGEFNQSLSNDDYWRFVFFTHGVTMDLTDITIQLLDEEETVTFGVTEEMVTIDADENPYIDKLIINIPQSSNFMQMGKSYKLRFLYNSDNDSVTWHDYELKPEVSVENYEPYNLYKDQRDFDLNFYGYNLTGDVNIQILKDGVDVIVDSDIRDFEQWEGNGFGRLPAWVKLDHSADVGQEYQVVLTIDDEVIATKNLNVGKYVYTMGGGPMVPNDDKFYANFWLDGDVDKAELIGKEVTFYTDSALNQLAPMKGEVVELHENTYAIKMEQRENQHTAFYNDDSWYYKIDGLNNGLPRDSNRVTRYYKYNIVQSDHNAFHQSTIYGTNTVFKFYTHGIDADLWHMTFDLINREPVNDDEEDIFHIDHDMVTVNTDNPYADILTITIPHDSYQMAPGREYKVRFAYDDGTDEQDWNWYGFRVDPVKLIVDHEPYTLISGERYFDMNFIGYFLEGDVQLEILRDGENCLVDQDIYGFDLWDYWSGHGQLRTWVKIDEGANADHDYEVKVFIDDELILTEPLNVEDYAYSIGSDMVVGKKEFYTSFWLDGHVEDTEIVGKTVFLYTDEDKTQPAHMEGEIVQLDNGVILVKMQNKPGENGTFIYGHHWYYEIPGLHNGQLRRKNILQAYDNFTILGLDHEDFYASTQSEGDIRFNFYAHGIKYNEQKMTFELVEEDNHENRYEITTENINIDDSDPLAEVVTLNVPKSAMIPGKHYKMVFTYRSLAYEEDWTYRGLIVERQLEVETYEPMGMPAGWDQFEMRLEGYQVEHADIMIYEVGNEGHNLIEHTWGDYIEFEEEDGFQARKLWVGLDSALDKEKAYKIKLSHANMVIEKDLEVGDFTYALGNNGLVPNDEDFYLELWLDGNYNIDELVDAEVEFYRDPGFNLEAPMTGIFVKVNDHFTTVQVHVTDINAITQDDTFYYKIPNIDGGVLRRDNALKALYKFTLVGADYEVFYNSVQANESTQFRFYTQNINNNLSHMNFKLVQEQDDSIRFDIPQSKITMDTSNSYVEILDITLSKDEYPLEVGKDYRIEFYYNDDEDQQDWSWGGFRVNHNLSLDNYEPMGLPAGLEVFELRLDGYYVDEADISIYDVGQEDVNLIENSWGTEVVNEGNDYKVLKTWVYVENGLEQGKEYELKLSHHTGEIVVPIQVGAFTYALDPNSVVPYDENFYMNIWLDGNFDPNTLIDKQVKFYTDIHMNNMAQMKGKIILLNDIPVVQVDAINNQVTAPDGEWYYKILDIGEGVNRRDNKVECIYKITVAEVDHDAFKESLSGDDRVFKFYTHGIPEDLSHMTFSFFSDDNHNDVYHIPNSMVEVDVSNPYADIVTITIPEDQLNMEIDKDYIVKLTYDDGDAHQDWHCSGFKVENDLSVAFDNQVFVATHSHDWAVFVFEGYAGESIDEFRIYRMDGNNPVNITKMDEGKVETDQLPHKSTEIITVKVKLTEPLDKNKSYKLELKDYDQDITLTNNILVSDTTFFIYSRGLIEGENESYVRVHSWILEDELESLEGLQVDIRGVYDDPQAIVGTGVIVEKEGRYYVKATLDNDATYEKNKEYYFFVKAGETVNGETPYICFGEHNMVLECSYSHVDHEYFWETYKNEEASDYVINIVGSKLFDNADAYTQLYLEIDGDGENRHVDIRDAIEDNDATYTIEEKDGLSYVTITLKKDCLYIDEHQSETVKFVMSRADDFYSEEYMQDMSYRIIHHYPLAHVMHEEYLDVNIDGFFLGDTQEVKVFDTANPSVNLAAQVEEHWKHEEDNGRSWYHMGIHLQENMIPGHIYEVRLINEEGNSTSCYIAGAEVAYHMDNNALINGLTTYDIPIYIAGDESKVVGKAVTFYSEDDGSIVPQVTGEVIVTAQDEHVVRMNIQEDFPLTMDGLRYSLDVDENVLSKHERRVYKFNGFTVFHIDQEALKASMEDSETHYNFKFRHHGLEDSTITELKLRAHEIEVNLSEATDIDYVWEEDSRSGIVCIRVPKATHPLEEGDYWMKIVTQDGDDQHDRHIGEFRVKKEEDLALLYDNQTFVASHGLKWAVFFVDGYNIRDINTAKIYRIDGNERVDITIPDKTLIEEQWYDDNNQVGQVRLRFRDLEEALDENQTYEIDIIDSDNGITITRGITVSNTTFYIYGQGLIEGENESYVRINSPILYDQLHVLDGLLIDIREHYDDSQSIIGTGVVVEREGRYFVKATLDNDATYAKYKDYYFFVKEGQSVNGVQPHICFGEFNGVDKHFYSYVDTDYFWDTFKDETATQYVIRAAGSKILEAADYSSIYLKVESDEERFVDLKEALVNDNATYEIEEKEGISYLTITLDKELLYLNERDGDTVIFGMDLEGDHLAEEYMRDMDYRLFHYYPLAHWVEEKELELYLEGYFLDATEEVQIVDIANPSYNLVQNVEDMYKHEEENGKSWYNLKITLKENMVQGHTYDVKLINNEGELAVCQIRAAEVTYDMEERAIIPGKESYVVSIHISGVKEKLIGKQLTFYADEDKQTIVPEVTGEVIELEDYKTGLQINVEPGFNLDMDNLYYSLNVGDDVLSKHEQVIVPLEGFIAFNEDHEAFYESMKKASNNYIFRFRHHGLAFSDITTLKLKSENHEVNLLTFDDIGYQWGEDDYSDIVTIQVPKATHPLLEEVYKLELITTEGEEEYHRELGDFFAKEEADLNVLYSNQKFIAAVGESDVRFLFEGYGVNRLEEAYILEDDVNITNGDESSTYHVRFDEATQVGLGVLNITLMDGKTFRTDKDYKVVFSDGNQIITKPVILTETGVYTHIYGLKENSSTSYVRMNKSTSATNLDSLIGETVNLSLDYNDAIGSGVVEKIADAYYIKFTLDEGVTFQRDTYYYASFNNLNIGITNGDYVRVSGHYFGDIDTDLFRESLHMGENYTIRVVGTNMLNDLLDYDGIRIATYNEDADEMTTFVDILSLVQSNSDKVSYSFNNLGSGITELTINIHKSVQDLQVQEELYFGMYLDNDMHRDVIVMYYPPEVKEAIMMAEDKISDNPYIDFTLRNIYPSGNLTLELYEVDENLNKVSANLITSNEKISVSQELEQGYRDITCKMTLNEDTILSSDNNYVLVVSDGHVMTETQVAFPQVYVPDYNKDGKIDSQDLDYLISHYDKKSSDATYNTLLDLNEDQLIDLFDLMRVSIQMD